MQHANENIGPIEDDGLMERLNLETAIRHDLSRRVLTWLGLLTVMGWMTFSVFPWIATFLKIIFNRPL